MEGGNGATIGSGITHSPTGEQNGLRDARKISREVRKGRKVLKISLCSLCSLWLKILRRTSSATRYDIRLRLRLSAGRWTRRRQAAAVPDASGSLLITLRSLREAFSATPRLRVRIFFGGRGLPRAGLIRVRAQDKRFGSPSANCVIPLPMVAPLPPSIKPYSLVPIPYSLLPTAYCLISPPIALAMFLILCKI